LLYGIFKRRDRACIAERKIIAADLKTYK